MFFLPRILTDLLHPLGDSQVSAVGLGVYNLAIVFSVQNSNEMYTMLTAPEQTHTVVSKQSQALTCFNNHKKSFCYGY